MNKIEYNTWFEFKKAKEKRSEMIEHNKPFVKNPSYEHPNYRYHSILFDPVLKSISSAISGTLGIY